MTDDSWYWLVGGIASVVVIGLLIRWILHFGEVVQAERARELFRLQHELFEHALVKAASATGKPEGLLWTECTIDGDALLVRDRPTGGIVALVPVTVRFEPQVGSDMEENPAAREPRPSTAVFTYHRGHWTTTGRVFFNLDPHHAVERSDGRYAVIEHH